MITDYLTIEDGGIQLDVYTNEDSEVCITVARPPFGSHWGIAMDTREAEKVANALWSAVEELRAETFVDIEDAILVYGDSGELVGVKLR